MSSLPPGAGEGRDDRGTEGVTDPPVHHVRRALGRSILPFSRGRGTSRAERGTTGHGASLPPGTPPVPKEDPRTVPRGELEGVGYRDIVRLLLRQPRTFLHRSRQVLAQRWRTSSQVRVIGSVFLSSLVVIMTLGFVLTSFVSQQLLDEKHDVAVAAIDSSRATVEEQIRSSDTSNSLQLRINAARAALTERISGTDESSGGSSTVFEPVVIAPDINGRDVSSPEQQQIPESLRTFVRQGRVADQYATVERASGKYKALIIGSPVSSDIQGLELYLVLPLDNEESTLGLMRGLLFAGAVALMVLLVVIAWVFSQQLTVPVRTASRIAERFAAGHLRERMAVDGQDEVARLAMSFNEMAENLSHQIRQLEDFGSLQQQFTSDVSHELRTPLTTVRMAADLIHDSAGDLDPMTRRASELMISELDRFEMLLGDLLEISRHDAGVANLSLETVDVRGVVKSTLEQVRAIAEEVGCTINLDLPEEPVNVPVDSRRVERILRNLLANAIDHSEGRPVDVTMRTGDGSLAVTVVDHGVGLKPGEAELVFNRFWRADPSRERRTGGTGLGLAIAKEDAQLHGGRLEATGEPGVGACFRLTLPLVPGEEVRTSPLPLEVDTVPVSAAVPAAAAGPAQGVEDVSAGSDTVGAGPGPADDLVDRDGGGVPAGPAVAEPAAAEPAAAEPAAAEPAEAGDSGGSTVHSGQIDDTVLEEAMESLEGTTDLPGFNLDGAPGGHPGFEGFTEEEVRRALEEAADMDDYRPEDDDDRR
ncbi:MAG: MtrAB system histidine kinase MtrB [Corynebacterium provencense]|uniref:MtrAB system histidine kinase MtrB n=1 Tax=Corynebacterium provencense TaxID=1737425 RepID=UPI00384D49BC|nr:MtrAB system histidine kinase MtrB [Corynebacterium provencense]